MKFFVNKGLKLLITIGFGFIFIFSFLGCKVADDDELILWHNQNDELKVLQFADLHFGEEGTIYHNSDIQRTLEFIDFAIKSENPDFIVLLGDNMMSQGVNGAQFIVNTFDTYQIPYTFVFGNHDAEIYSYTYSKSEVSSYLENSESSYLLYESGYIQENSENRYGNFSIKIKDIKTHNLLGAFIILDTGVYDYQQNQYQSINLGQIEWYKEEINKLNNIYTSQQNNPLVTIPTITYGHIQLPEYADAYTKAKNNDGAEFIYYQELSDWSVSGLVDDAGKINFGFFDVMKEMESSKAYFCGHMHRLKYHVKMDDIILGFCPQACVTGSKNATIETISYTVNDKFEMNFNLIAEPEKQ
jgi:predicted MPP superfamily phosphohydrolase